jgi:hypothetical protein
MNFLPQELFNYFFNASALAMNFLVYIICGRNL